MLFGMPLGEFFMSVGTIAFSVNWLIEGDLNNKLKRGIQNKLALGILTVLAIHLLGLIWTNSLVSSVHDLKIKLPFFLLPFFFSSKPIFSAKQLKQLLYVFVGATILSSLISTYVYFDISSKEDVFDVREISIFISHIRQSMMVVFSIAILIYFTLKNELNKALTLPAILFLIGYLILLQSLTGLVLLIVFIIVLPIWIHGFNLKSALGSGFLLVSFSLAIIYLSKPSYEYYFTPKNQEQYQSTPFGNPYQHNLGSKQLEGGFYVWRNLAEQELKDSWENRSQKPYVESSGALIRFITSLGTPKDGRSVENLTNHDIKLIENGITSRRNLQGVTKRIDETLFEIAAYFDGQNPSHNSVAQRLFAWDLAKTIFKKNYLIGVGTGGTKKAFEEAYDNSKFQFTKRIRAHNQFITFLLSFGLFAGIICIIVFVFPFYYGIQDKLFIAFYAIVVLSFLFEDTLETQPGVLFAGFFIGLFLQRINSSNKASNF